MRIFAISDNADFEVGMKLAGADSISLNNFSHTSTIIVYCRRGNRSSTAANLLIKLGYENVYDMGGITNWPYDLVIG